MSSSIDSRSAAFRALGWRISGSLTTLRISLWRSPAATGFPARITRAGEPRYEGSPPICHCLNPAFGPGAIAHLISGLFHYLPGLEYLTAIQASGTLPPPT